MSSLVPDVRSDATPAFAGVTPEPPCCSTQACACVACPACRAFVRACALDGKDDRGAFAHLLRAAEAGHGAAAQTVGYLLELGQGVARDEERALHWYRRAAGLGDAID